MWTAPVSDPVLDPYPRPGLGLGRRLARRHGDEPEPLDPVGGVDHARRPAQVDEVPGRGEGQRRREALGDVGRTRPAAGDPPLGRGVDPREQPQQG